MPIRKLSQRDLFTQQLQSVLPRLGRDDDAKVEIGSIYTQIPHIVHNKVSLAIPDAQEYDACRSDGC